MSRGSRRRCAAGLAVVGILALAGCAQPLAQAPVPVTRPRLDVIWVPSDMAVVGAMLDLAVVRPDDVVYDLGCGDGRIVIEAARRFGVRAVGVDLDPALLREARRNAAQANVADRVTFLEQDLFTTDLSEATVVTLYLLPEVNLRLRPKLLRELRPGARIVSHEHDLGDWRPDMTIEISLPERNHYVFLWRVPPSRR
jgi:SAM-dependent methyltransferase